jgi:hypothetical protein
MCVLDLRWVPVISGKTEKKIHLTPSVRFPLWVGDKRCMARALVGIDRPLALIVGRALDSGAEGRVELV